MNRFPENILRSGKLPIREVRHAGVFISRRDSFARTLGQASHRGPSSHEYRVALADSPSEHLVTQNKPLFRSAAEIPVRIRCWWGSRAVNNMLAKVVLYGYGAILLLAGVVLFVFTDMTPVLPFWFCLLGAGCINFGRHANSEPSAMTEVPRNDHVRP